MSNPPQTFATIAAAFSMLIHQLQGPERDPVQTIDSSQILDFYDFIIIGAGSAGSAVANRLTEIPEWRVLLLEAGHQETTLSRTPGMDMALVGTRFDWNYTTTPQKLVCQANQGKCSYTQGRALGGSSSVNGMIYARGYKSDYDKWGVDNCGWSFRDVEPYFIQAEGNRIPGLTRHGRKGPLTVSYAPYRAPLAEHILEAGIADGLKNADCPNYENGCIYRTMSTERDGRRCSASTAYLEPISTKRPNLHILTGAEVTKVITDNNDAKGVEFVSGGQKKIVLSTKEVVISAGALNTPKILMLSGVGPKKHLGERGIQVVADLPVGKNLQDHVRINLPFIFKDGLVTTIEDLADHANQVEYLNTQTGPLSYAGSDAVAWARVGGFPNGTPPNVQYIFITRSSRAGASQGAVFFSVAQPNSRGSVMLNSTNPHGQPLIDVNYFGDARDWQTAIDGFQYAYNLFTTPALAPFVVSLDQNQIPLCNITPNSTDLFNCIIKFYTGTQYHPVGTAKMAPRTKDGVVNAKLQVYGVRNLRVIDNSIAPTIISMNTNPMAVMIGEKGADIIKASYGKRTHQRMRTCGRRARVEITVENSQCSRHNQSTKNVPF